MSFVNQKFNFLFRLKRCSMALKKSSTAASKKVDASKKKTTKTQTATPKAAPKKKAESANVMDMNSAFYLRKEDNERPKWRVIDAKGQVLGRMATQIADILRGKDRPYF